jgi:hypothetical protein
MSSVANVWTANAQRILPPSLRVKLICSKFLFKCLGQSAFQRHLEAGISPLFYFRTVSLTWIHRQLRTSWIEGMPIPLTYKGAMREELVAIAGRLRAGVQPREGTTIIDRLRWRGRKFDEREDSSPPPTVPEASPVTEGPSIADPPPTTEPPVPEPSSTASNADREKLKQNYTKKTGVERSKKETVLGKEQV